MTSFRTLGLLGALTLLCTVVIGCSESPDQQVDLARIALQNNQSQQAIDYASRALAKEPGRTDALRLLVEANLNLSRMPEAKQAIDELLSVAPSDEDARRLALKWGVRSAEGKLQEDDLLEDTASFDAAIEFGREQADWMAEIPGREGEAEFARARLFAAEHDRYKKEADLKRDELSKYELTGEFADLEVIRGEIAALDEKLSSLRGQMEEHMHAALVADPNLHEARNMFALYLVRNKRFEEAFATIREVAALPDVPTWLADRLIVMVLSVDSNASVAERIELANGVYAAMNAESQKKPQGKFALARIKLAEGEAADAEPLLREAFESMRSMDAGYLLGRSLYETGQYEEAKKVLGSLLDKGDKFSALHTLYGRVLWELGDREVARQSLRKATTIDPNDKVARETFIYLMASGGDIDVISPEINEYYTKNPDAPGAIRYKLKAMRSASDKEGVAELMEAVANIEPRTDEITVLMIEGYAELEQYDKVESLAEELHAKHPDQLEYATMLIRAKFALNKGEEGRVLADATSQKFPEFRADEMIGELFLLLRRPDVAIPYLEREVARSIDNTKARLLLAQAQAQLGAHLEALVQLRDVLEGDPGNIEANSLASRVYLAIGNPTKAAEHLDAIDMSRIDEVEDPALRAQLKWREGDIDQAISICHQALATGVKSPLMRLLLSKLYEGQGQIDKAEEQLLALVREEPDRRQGFFLLTRFYIKNSSFDRGRLALLELQALNEPMARLSLATILGAQAKYDEALEHLEAIYEPLIAKKDPAALRISNAMSAIYRKKGENEKAVAVFQKLIDANMNPIGARLEQIDVMWDTTDKASNIAKLNELADDTNERIPEQRHAVLERLMRAEAFDVAFRWVDKWIAESESKAVLMLWKAEMLQKTDKPAEAAKVLEKAVILDPKSVVLKRRLAEAHLRAYNLPEAERAWRAMGDLNDTAKAVGLARLGYLYATVGLAEQAALAYSELESMEIRHDPDVLFLMGVSMEKAGQDVKALERFGDVPNSSPRYAAAQLRIAQIEQRMGVADEAKRRIERVAADRRIAGALVQQLLNLNPRQAGNEQIMSWADSQIDLASVGARRVEPWLRRRLALAMMAENWSKAESIAAHLSQLNPDSDGLAAARVLLLIRAGRASEAKTLLTDTPAVKNSADGVLLARLLGEKSPPDVKLSELAKLMLLLEAGEWDEANSEASSLQPLPTVFGADVTATIKALQVDPEKGRAAGRDLLAALVAYSTGLPDLGAAYAREAIDDVEGFVLAYAVLARGAAASGDSSSDLLAGLAKVAPDAVLTRYLKAEGAILAGRHDEALKLLDSVIKDEPANYHVRYWAANQLNRGQHYDKGIPMLEEIAKLPGAYQAAAANDLAYLLAETQPERMAEAEKLAAAALRAAPSSPALLDTYGWIKFLQGKPREALAMLQPAAVRLGEMPEVQFHLGSAYRAAGEQEWARYYLRAAAMQKSDKPEVQRAREMLKKLDSNS